MVQLGCAQNLANIVASCRNQLQDETVQFKLQSAADIIVLLLTEGNSHNFIMEGFILDYNNTEYQRNVMRV